MEKRFSESEVKRYQDLTGFREATCQVIMVKYMNCLICRQAEIVDSCGESIVDEDVAVRLLSKAEEVVNEGIFEGVRDYGK